MPTRRGLLLAAAGATPALHHPALALSVPEPPAWAPSHPIRLVVPYPPGGVIDLLGRLLAEALPPRLGQPLVVENLPGAGSVIGAQAIQRAAPDGHSLLLTTSTTFAVAPTLYRRPPFDPVRDFTAIALLAATTFVLVVRTEGPASLAAFIAGSKAAQGRISYGTSGAGTPHHIGFELLKQIAGFEATHIPYRGTAAALVDLLAGRLDVMIADIPPAVEHIRAGTLRPLAVTNRERLAALPEVPTLIEQGLPGCEAPGWVGVAAPAGVPVAAARALSAAVVQTMAQPAWRVRVEALALLPMLMGAEDFSSFIPAEIARWAPVIRASGASAD
jgi:tripartite-type tricarboxylate transporter receptor subunit TctC